MKPHNQKKKKKLKRTSELLFVYTPRPELTTVTIVLTIVHNRDIVTTTRTDDSSRAKYSDDSFISLAAIDTRASGPLSALGMSPRFHDSVQRSWLPVGR